MTFCVFFSGNCLITQIIGKERIHSTCQPILLEKKRETDFKLLKIFAKNFKTYSKKALKYICKKL